MTLLGSGIALEAKVSRTVAHRQEVIVTFTGALVLFV